MSNSVVLASRCLATWLPGNAPTCARRRGRSARAKAATRPGARRDSACGALPAPGQVGVGAEAEELRRADLAVWVEGFEPPVSGSRNRRSCQAELHPESPVYVRAQTALASAARQKSRNRGVVARSRRALWRRDQRAGAIAAQKSRHSAGAVSMSMRGGASGKLAGLIGSRRGNMPA